MGGKPSHPWKQRGPAVIVLALLTAVLLFYRVWVAPFAVPEGMSSAVSAARKAPPAQRRPRLHPIGEEHIELSPTRQTATEGLGAFEGRVLSRDGEAGVPGAQLSFYDGALNTIEADGAGRFAFRPPRAGVYELALVTAEGFLPFAPEHGHSPVVFTARPGAGVAGARVLLTPSVEYRARVVAPGDDRVAVPGAQIVALGGTAPGAGFSAEESRWTTGADGEALVFGDEGTVFEASHPDYAPGRALLDFGALLTHELTIPLQPRSSALHYEAQVSGRVVGNGMPLPDALVIASHQPQDAARPDAAIVPEMRAVTDESGRFAITNLAPGHYDLLATAAGFAPVSRHGVMAPSQNIELVLESGAGLFGRVRDETGAPISSFVVVVRERLSPLRQEVVLAESTFDPQGQYAIPALPRGTFSVTVSSYGFAPALDRLVEIGDSDVRADFSLSRGTTLHGRVSDANTHQPIEGARVLLEGSFGGRRVVQLAAASRSGADGRFTLQGVSPGAQSLLVAASAHHGRVIPLSVEAGPGSELAIELTPTEGDDEPGIELAGIGAKLSAQDDALLVVGILEASGAQEVGLGPEDAIVAIDGVPVVELGFMGAIRKIRGPVGSTVLLSVVRSGAEAAETLVVPRRKVRG